MQYAIKIIISLAIILTCGYVAKKNPTLAGLIGTMPLTGLLVVLWVWHEDAISKSENLPACVKGAVFGIGPSFLFFLIMFLCLRWNLPKPAALAAGVAAWVAGAFVHQAYLK